MSKYPISGFKGASESDRATTPTVPAPAGWGYPPGHPMGEITAADLPELQLLDLVVPAERNAAVTNALRALPYLRQIRPCHVTSRYRINPTCAADILDRARSRISAAQVGLILYRLVTWQGRIWRR